MLISISIVLVFYMWALVIWRTTPPLISDAELESEDFRYTYTTTPMRRLIVMLGSCTLFSLTMWLVTFALGYFIWEEIFSVLTNNHRIAKTIVFLSVTGIVLLLMRLPKPRRFLTEICFFFQRCQFFPMLPSPQEESLIEQISKLPIGIVPDEIRQALSKDAPQDVDLKTGVLWEDYEKLEIIHKELKLVASTHRGFVKRFYFGREWELIDNQFKVIDKKMHDNTSDVDDALAKKIHTCLYYSYGLLTRVIMETSASQEESKDLFKRFGFDVRV
ncbi:hypothetical protein [Aurantivibrio infirmus]